MKEGQEKERSTHKARRCVMKKKYGMISIFALCFILSGLVSAEQVKDDIAVYKTCKYCGMDRGTYNYTRMLIEYDDGSVAAFCSLHCAAVDLATNIDKTPKSIRVGDFNGKQLIDAETALWVVGGSKPGVMSRRGKWAFESQDAAESFVKANQGKNVSFNEAIRMAYEDMYNDTKAIRERRKMKRMQIVQPKPEAGR
jgi:copper chaperone NosL